MGKWNIQTIGAYIAILATIVGAAWAVATRTIDSEKKLTEKQVEQLKKEIKQLQEQKQKQNTTDNNANLIQFKTYFKDVDKKNNKFYQYISRTGSLKMIQGEGFFSSKTDANDTREMGQLKSYSWDVMGYKTTDKIYFAYNPGIAYLTEIATNNYVGYWIGTSADGKIVKCPYVITGDQKSYNETEAIQMWPKLAEECCEYNMIEDKCKALPGFQDVYNK